MAVAPQVSPFEILDLRLVRGRALTELFAEEQQMWRDELHWDFRPSVEMIRKHVEAQSLPGFAARSRGRMAGYCFYVYEDEKGLLGDLYVMSAHRGEQLRADGAGIATLLVEQALDALERSPVVRRIEAQLIGFGLEPLAPLFETRGFRVFPRLFFYRAFAPGDAWPAAADSPGAVVRGWVDADFDPMAELIVVAYANHVDSQINDHYSGRAGALRFLKNIVLFPVCGVFQRDCSLVALADGRLVGAVLVSMVAPRIGHITQLCLHPAWQGRGLGRRLMEAALGRMTAKGYHGVSLTVTAENHGAVALYRKLGFETLKEFGAYSRELR